MTSSKPLRVLVIDDSPPFRRQVCDALEASGLSAVEASEGYEALWRVRSEGVFDLILADIHMPNLDGVVFIREVRKLPEYADVPIFVRGANAWAEGVGEILTPVELPPAWYLLADPGVHAPTAALFQTPELTRDSAPATMRDFVSGAVLDNAFEPVLRRREPAVEAAFAALAQVGEPRLTGSGSGCFVEFGDRASAQAALQSLSPGLGAWIAGGAARSALHAALDAFRLQGRRQVVQGTGF